MYWAQLLNQSFQHMTSRDLPLTCVPCRPPSCANDTPGSSSSCNTLIPAIPASGLEEDVDSGQLTSSAISSRRRTAHGVAAQPLSRAGTANVATAVSQPASGSTAALQLLDVHSQKAILTVGSSWMQVSVAVSRNTIVGQGCACSSRWNCSSTASVTFAKEAGVVHLADCSDGSLLGSLIGTATSRRVYAYLLCMVMMPATVAGTAAYR